MCDCRKEEEYEDIVAMTEGGITFKVVFIYCLYCDEIKRYRARARTREATDNIR